MVSTSNLAYILDTAKDIGEQLPEKDSVAKKAGYLLVNIIVLHPFVDGNKRTGFAVAKTFLTLNGWHFRPQEEEAFEKLLIIAREAISVEAVEQWIASNLSRVERVG